MKESTDIFANQIENLLRSLLEEGYTSFRELSEAAGLDPAKDFSGVDLSGLDFRDEDLSGFNFSGADLRQVDFRRAAIQGVNFSGANIEGAIGLDLFRSAVTDNPRNRRELKRNLSKGILPPEDLMASIDELRFGDTQIYDIEIITKLKNLRVLSLINRFINDFSPVKKIKSLEKLMLDGSNIVTFSEIGPLPGIVELTASGSALDDVSGLGINKKLVWLDISRTDVETIGTIRAPNIRKLNVSETGIEDIDIVKDMEGIRWIDISETSIRELSPLRGKKNLQYLNAYSTLIDSIEPLSDCQAIESLLISETPVTDLQPVATLSKLASFHARSIQGVLGLEAVIASKSLKYLFLGDNDLGTEVFDVSEMESLIVLDIAGSDVQKLKIPTHVNHIESLHLDRTKIGDIEFVANAPNIKLLSIMGTGIKDFFPLRNIKTEFRLSIDKIEVDQFISLWTDTLVGQLDMPESVYENMPKIEGIGSAYSFYHLGMSKRLAIRRLRK